jgi:hypothetical protein
MCWEEVFIEGGGKLDLYSFLATVFLLEVYEAPQITSQTLPSEPSSLFPLTGSVMLRYQEFQL